MLIDNGQNMVGHKYQRFSPIRWPSAINCLTLSKITIITTDAFATMKRLTLLLPLLWLLAACSRDDDPMTALYRQIDRAIADSAQAVARVEARIDSLKRQMPGGSRIRIAEKLYEAYSAYDNDSAVAWAMRYDSLAQFTDDGDHSSCARLDLIYQYTKSGYFTEATDYFTAIDPSLLSPRLQARYYDIGADLYGNAGYATEDPVIRQRYWQRSITLRDSSYLFTPRHSTLYMRNRVQELINADSGRAALAVSREWIRMTPPGTHDYAIAAYYRSEAYRRAGDIAHQKEWLARSAIADLNNAVMDQASLWMLAGIIYREGNIDRAFRYMDYSWHCVQRFSAHKRSWDVTPILTVISSSYQTKTHLANERLTALLITAALLLIISISLLLYVQRKRHQLGEARNALDHSNRQLRLTIEQLNRVNADLSESDRVKDQYIGNFFSLFSSMLENLDSFRAKVRRKLKAGQSDELLAMTDPENKNQEMHKQLMKTFDDTFLTLYPNFVEEFNALLRPGCSVRPSGKERMNTTLRIFALIRLGITESSRIADILGYSPVSIYNYRTRAKNLSACPRDEFEEKIRIVSPQTAAP